ncbi:hypothetical protein K469DRAFT_260299 [Zopfia rhizophila CBS 207.26]|uniref:Uncharacterized protein n=1 Tax=Zopfia rhizophila CBS 207.26 TaxID=1314779 RepID=A0A6A6DPR2_9PEZI|nr:hypothetical protein K469DRAFT_260299 [Zopfia rhizophila CBS 207.26]
MHFSRSISTSQVAGPIVDRYAADSVPLLRMLVVDRAADGALPFSLDPTPPDNHEDILANLI